MNILLDLYFPVPHAAIPGMEYMGGADATSYPFFMQNAAACSK